LQEPILPKCLTRFRAPWRWAGEPAVLTSRATDETGYVQPSREEILKQRDKRSYYHYNGMQRWRLNIDGGVVNAG
jgi:sulfane dehydrogenase subunit SoxC